MAIGGDTARELPQGVWKLALATAAAIWGGSFVVIKGALDAVPPCWLMTVRFTLATLVLVLVFRRRLARAWRQGDLAAGAALGVAEGLGFVVQNLGLVCTTPGRNAFLTAIYSVLVPFMTAAMLRRRPAARSLVAAALGVAGVGLLSLGDDLSLALGGGDWLSLLSAVFFALQIVLVARFSASHDVIVLTVLQMAGCAVVALLSALVLREPLGAGFLAPRVGWSLAYLVLLSSCLCFVLQNVGQSKVPPAQAALLLSLESVFAVLASVVFYHEVVTVRMAAGFGLIFAAVLASELGGGEARA